MAKMKRDKQLKNWDKRLAELAYDSKYALGSNALNNHDCIVHWAQDNAKLIVEWVTKINFPKFAKIKCTWELPVGSTGRSSRFDNRGFVDLYIKVTSADEIHMEDIKFEELYGVIGWEGFGICVEAKSFIKSIGETIRQINYYRQCLQGKQYMVVISPDASSSEIFIDQDILFIEYPYTPLNSRP